MSKSSTSIRDETNPNKLKARNELTHTSNQNCALPSSEDEEQKPILVEGRSVGRSVLDLAFEGGGGWT